MPSFKEWLKIKEMLSPVPFPSITNMSPDIGRRLKVNTALNSHTPKLPRWRREMLKKDDQSGYWKQ